MASSFQYWPPQSIQLYSMENHLSQSQQNNHLKDNVNLYSESKTLKVRGQATAIIKQKLFRSLPTRPANKKVLLFGDDGHICDNIRGFLESIRIGYSHVKNFDSDISVLPKLYDRNSNPDFASIIFCSFRKSCLSFYAGSLPF